MLLTPSDKPAGNMDRTMLLSLWTKQLARQGTKTYAAGMGRPTYPLNSDTALFTMWYWLRLAVRSAATIVGLRIVKFLPFLDSYNFVAMLSPALDYGHPRGELSARTRMANTLNRWYGNKLDITEQNILFTVGGAGALHNIFEVINNKNPNGKILTQFPHYTLYQGTHRQNNLFAIPVMNSPGYKLTATLLDESIQLAYQLAKIDGNLPSAFLLCDPNNPLGTTLNNDELTAIAEVLRKYPEILIILDEAYAEMRLDAERVSLLSAAPDLKNRIILMRSATKALSAAGERMAVTVVFDDALMEELVTENIGICGHAPQSLQFSFAHAMEKLTRRKQKKLIDYYIPQISFVENKIKEMGIGMPDKAYRSTGTFYAIANLNDFIGTPINKECFRALPREDTKKNEIELIQTDEEIVYHLLFSYGIMIAPFSYFGINKKLGYVRITCSAGNTELQELMQKLEMALKEARAYKKQLIPKKVTESNTIEQLDFAFSQQYKFRKSPSLIKTYQNEIALRELWGAFVLESTINQNTRQNLLGFSIEEIQEFKPFSVYLREFYQAANLHQDFTTKTT